VATAPTPEPSPASTAHTCPTVFGWREHVDIPGWGIRRLRAKLDTGARTSALHVEDFEELEVGAGAGPGAAGDGELPLVRFHVLTGPRATPRRVEVTTPVVGHTIIRDTRARPEQRPIVRARVVCGPLDREIEISLTDRTGMNFRLLLGRLALEGTALVDPAHGFLVTDPPRRPVRPDLEDRE
jgi:hypothetical protein